MTSKHITNNKTIWGSKKMINKSTITKTLLLVIMMVLLLSPVQAALIVNKVSDEFSLGSPYPIDNVKVCQCGLRTDILEIENIGDFKALFKVDIHSPITELITLSEDTFVLEPCESTKVYVYIQAPCDQPINSFYVARVHTDYGRSKEIYKEIVSKKCQNIKCDVEVLNERILPGDQVNIEVDVQNVGEFTDTFKIIPRGACEDNINLINEELLLDSDEESSAYIKFQAPLNVYGEQKCDVGIYALKNDEYVLCGDASFNIESDYDFSIKTEDLELEACEDVITKKTVTIKNLAEQTPNKYFLELRGPKFVSLTQEELSLEAGEEQSLTLNIEPTQADVGDYEISIVVRTEYGNVQKIEKTQLHVNDCFDSGAKLDDSDILVEKSCSGKQSHILNIRNDGLYEEAYEITIDGPNWLNFKDEDNFVRLRPGQNKDIPLTITYPETDTKATAFVMVTQLRAPYQKHEIKLELEGLSPRSCYQVELLQDEYRINYDTKSIPMLIQNTGLKGGLYELELGELDSKFVHLQESTVELKAGETKVIHLTPWEYGDYTQGRYLNKLSLGINLIESEDSTYCEEADCSVGSLEYYEQFWVVLKDKNFIVKAIDYIKNFNYSRIGWCGLLTLILLVLTVTAFITVGALKTKKNYKIKRIKVSVLKKIKILNAAIIFLIILAVLSLILVGTPNMNAYYEEPLQVGHEASPLVHEWRQNSDYKINLNNYFEDPDLDPLSYTASQPDHIAISIDASGVATFRPEINWAGTEQVVFTADDNKGGFVDSPIMTLHIMKKKPVSFMGYWNLYCSRINIILLILICLAGLLISDFVEDKGYNYYRPGKNGKKAAKKISEKKKAKKKR